MYTRALPCLRPPGPADLVAPGPGGTIYNLFYVNGVKVIPATIYELFSPIALAHMIMGDGKACLA
ncbi:hypothetical protein BC938DRAFT_483358 [Jimgerdemannia flammicorona]|uniref:Homing endonuclease LAGLIDADG domain-containing protein n=1 Tax=Jimgerdemannia flammicorona TaxID=994334 RepID=A0A433QC54_9FUNG|nr:hypothetical protein BC938DRAFT_483358 [Jimgerdemannia flammicorona]